MLVVGQDPYPTPGHPIGLSFAVEKPVWPLPRSLINIYLELRNDVDVMPPRHGDLSGWADQGVMLLNRVLTVRPGESASHRGRGWEEVTERAIAALVERGGPCVAILWGRDAQSLKPMLGPGSVGRVRAPLAALGQPPLFGSRPFSRVNRMLEEQGATPVDWALPADSGYEQASVRAGRRRGPGSRSAPGCRLRAWSSSRETCALTVATLM